VGVVLCAMSLANTARLDVRIALLSRISSWELP